MKTVVEVRRNGELVAKAWIGEKETRVETKEKVIRERKKSDFEQWAWGGDEW